jgi:hypothetical protein
VIRGRSSSKYSNPLTPKKVVSSWAGRKDMGRNKNKKTMRIFKLGIDLGLRGKKYKKEVNYLQ